MKPGINVVKVGGAVVEDRKSLVSLLSHFAAIPGYKALVHGGGRSATALAGRLGLETKMIEGRRVTDDSMLEVVTMVYGGLVNKNIVAALQARGMTALGLTGADLGYMLSDRRPSVPVDYGWVGDVKEVNSEILSELICKGIVPVLAPLTCDGKGNLLNTNADTIASRAASALTDRFEVTLSYCFEMPGVIKGGKVIPEIDRYYFETLKEEGTISGGMIPKLENAFTAISAGVSKVIITDIESLGTDLGTTIHD